MRDREIRPQHIGEVNLRVRDVPQQKIADALLAAGSDQQIDTRTPGRLQRSGELVFVDVLRIDEGEPVTILREGKPLATFTPTIRGYGGVPYPFRDFDFGPRPKNLTSDPAQLIIEERERERSGKKWRS